MDEQPVSLNEIRKKYDEEGDIELSTYLTVKINLAVFRKQDEEGDWAEESGIQITFNDDDDYHTATAFVDGDWNLDSIAETFKIDPDAKVWEAQENMKRDEIEAAILKHLEESQNNPS